MLDLIKQYWHSFKSTPDIWFFFMFLSTSTLSIRKVLYFFPINNSFNEYTGVYIYLSDIFLILTFLFYILYNINFILSNIHHFVIKSNNKIRLFHVEQLQKSSQIFNSNVPRGILLLFKKTYTHIINNYLIIFPLFIAFFSFLSILWTSNRCIGLFRSLKLLEFILLYFYIINIFKNGLIKKTTLKLNKQYCSTWNNIKNKLIVPSPPRNMFHVEHWYQGGTILKNIILLIVIPSIIQSFIGIMQFIIQHTIGFFWLKESLISKTIPGVAKIIFGNDAYVRAYGLFPHPNIFGGYLVLSILLSLLYIKLFHVEQFETLNNKSAARNTTIAIVPRGTIALFIVTPQIVALLLTFSKSAIIGLFIALFYINIKTKDENVPRGTIISKIMTLFKVFHVEHFKKKLVLIASILFILLVTLKPNINSLFIKSLNERGFYLNVSRGTFYTDPLLGIGAGQFIANMANNYNLESWQFQPVHNVFLLILNEFGIFILFGFIYFIYKLFRARPVECSTWNINTCIEKSQTQKNIVLIYLMGTLLAYLFIMFFDHYFWDIQQGQILLWTLLALIVAQKAH